MEKAIHIAKLKDLKYFKPAYRRLYWGNEFCQNLIPSLAETQKILRFMQQKGLHLTFVTPFVTETGLKKLEKTFKWFKENNVKPEVVVNDWGVLERLNKRYNGYFSLSLGRLLTRQQRDPLVKTIISRQPPVFIRDKSGRLSVFVHHVPEKGYSLGVKSSHVNLKAVQGFLFNMGIGRVELSNVLQGPLLDGIHLKKSMYTPFVNISTTRFCPMESKFQKMYRMDVCKRECRRFYYKLRNKIIPKVIYKRGNTLFYKNPVLLKEINKLCVDRVVYQPELPY